MTIFKDKEQEIEQLINYIRIIVGSAKPKWHVTPETFSVTIPDVIEREFSKAELESYEQQIKYLQSVSYKTDDKTNDKIKIISKNKKTFDKYLKVLENIRKRHKICSDDYCSVYDPEFHGDQYLYIDAIEKNKENDKLPLFSNIKLTGNNDINSSNDPFDLGPKDYYSIGRWILNSDNKIDLNQELLAIYNTFGYTSVDNQIIKDFVKDEFEKNFSIDPIKIGRKFVKYLSEKADIKADYKNYDLDKKISNNESFSKLKKFIMKFDNEHNLFIVNVPKPGHTLHLIQPSYILYAQYNKRKDLKYLCPQKNIIFCNENSNFQVLLNNLSKSTKEDLNFIVHPENLRSDEMERLKTFISTRRSQNIKPKENDKKNKNNTPIVTPFVMIITALPPSFFAIEGKNAVKFNDSFSFDEDDISEFATFNTDWRRSVCNNHSDIFLFSSNQPGIGKTYRINNILKKSANNFADTKKGHIYFDITTKEIPESIIDLNFIHVSISTELFLNNFQIFDQLYILIQYGYFIFKSGLHVSYYRGTDIITTFLIEIPNLDEDNEFKKFYDFPIASTNNDEKLWKEEEHNKNQDIYDIIKNEFKEIGNEDYFKKGLFHLNASSNQIKIENEDVNHLIKLVFGDKSGITIYKDLIEKSKEFFFTEKVNDESYIDDNRIISKVKNMIENYSSLIVKEYNDNEYMKKFLFLLTIRTVLYIWHFTPSKSRSIILLVPKRIMTIDAFKKNHGWIFVGFCSCRDKNKKWNKGNFYEIDTDSLFIDKAKDIFKENPKYHILSDDSSNNSNNNNSKEVEIKLQIQFFKTILQFLPSIDISKSSKNPLNIALILLSLFSNMNHYPDTYLSSIISDFKKYDLQTCQKKFEGEFYGQKIEWTEMDELLMNYFQKNNDIDESSINTSKLILQLKSELSEYENIWNIIKISFSKTYFARFIEIILKVYYKHFTILQGETGCGKTSVINLLYDVILLAKNDENMKYDIKWSFLSIDFHGSYLQKDFDDQIDYIKIENSMNVKELEENDDNTRIIIFLDEVNTSPAYYYVIDHIQNSESKYFSYIGAINAFVEVNPVTRKLSRVGIPQNINRQLSNIKLFSHPEDNLKALTKDFDVNKYAYNVKKEQKSIHSAIIKADPQEFDENDPIFARYLPDEERNAIRSIITKILLQWDNNTFIDLPRTIKLASELIFKIFKSVRSFMKLRAIFSYRDVHRCITIFTYIFDYFKKKNLENMLSKEKRGMTKEFMTKITSISVVIAIYISLISRFSHEEIDMDEKIEMDEETEKDDNIRKRFEVDDEILNELDVDSETKKKLKKHPFADYLTPDSTKICMYKLILSYISDKQNWPTELKEVPRDNKEEPVQYKEEPVLPYIKDWEYVSVLFAYAKCMKYIIDEKELVYPLPSLMFHLLIFSLSVSASFKEINITGKGNKTFSSSDFFTCLIIGMPGTSKSKAIEIYKKYHLNKIDDKYSKHKYFITTYLCSRSSDSDSLLAQFLNGAWFLEEKSYDKIKKAIVILEEVGLANYNPSRPLKILHSLCDKGVPIKRNNRVIDYRKIIPVQLSNYAIDFANMNRGFLVCAGLPTDIELYSSIAFGNALKGVKIQNRLLSKKILFEITQLEDRTISNYGDVIDIVMNTVMNKVPDNFVENKKFYASVLNTLWNITQDNHQRPSFYPMRPLFNLINGVTKLKTSKKIKGSMYDKLAFTLNSFIHDKEIIEKVYNPSKKTDSKQDDSILTNFLTPLGLLPKEEKKINSITLFKLFLNDKIDRKAIMIRTQDYEAFRYINLFKDKEEENFMVNFIPFQFQDVAEDSQVKFNILFDIICEDDDECYIFCSVGNDPFSDYIIDILNSINQNNQCPTAILKGFPVYLPSFPDNIKFISIINEDEIYNHKMKNPVPYPLIDRLDHIFINKNILKYYHEDVMNECKLEGLRPKYLLDLPLTKKDKEKVKANPNESEKSYLLTYEKSDFEFLLDALNDSKNGKTILDNHFKNTFIKSLKDLIEIMKSDINGGLNFSSAVVFTRTPIYEKLDYDENEEFITVKNITSNPDEIMFNVENIDIEIIKNKDGNGKRKKKTRKLKDVKSVIIHSDLFNIPDENTINNALSIIYETQLKIISDTNRIKQCDNEMNKPLYIIIFHINENRVPESFGSTSYFPVIWIESLIDSPHESPLIQQICTAVFNGTLQGDSPLLSRVYEKLSNDIIEQLEPKNKEKINKIKSENGVKLADKKNNKFTIKDIIDLLFKQNEADSSSSKPISFSDIRDEIKTITNQIQENLNEEKDENERIKENKIQNDKLNNLDLEIRFFSTVSHLIDDKVSATLSIVIKYCAAIKLDKTKRETINSFIITAYEQVIKFSEIVKDISFDTFSSPDKKNEIKEKHPELLFYNILNPYFKEKPYYNSINNMKKLIEILPFKDMQLNDIFTYINDNYYSAKPGIPFNSNDKPDKLTIDVFNDFFNARGLIYKNAKTSKVCDFFKANENDDFRPNLFSIELAVENVKGDINSEKWDKINYKQILLSDCYKNFMDTCVANDYPHPSIIYSHFINVPNFSFNDYNDGDPDEKIYKNQLIPWTINFFLYGSYNKCKKPGKESNYLYNLVDFIDLGYTKDKANFGMKMSTSIELFHFIADVLFTELCCTNPNSEKIESFNYIDYLNKNSLFNSLLDKYGDSLKNNLESNDIIKEVSKIDIDLPEEGFDKLSPEIIQAIKDNFKEISEIENEIIIYQSWKTENLTKLANQNILDLIRSNLFEDSTMIDDKFGIWFLNSKVPLLTRQVYEICKAINDDVDKERIESEFNILTNLLNPWNNDKRITLVFWKLFVDNIPKKPFERAQKFNNQFKDWIIFDPISNCLPYYICDYESDGIIKHTLFYKRKEIKTFFIERLLYSNTIYSSDEIAEKTEKKDKKDKKVKKVNHKVQLFDFMTNLPFAKQTKNIYILAGFVNEIMRDFRDQINLLFFILYTCQNCSDLLNIGYFNELINNPKRTESPEALKNAFLMADKYNQGKNAAEKMKSYINRLIEINNNTILHDKKEPENLHYRLIAKINLHSNISLMNTFVPALSHFDSKLNDAPPKFLPNAVKLLVGNYENIKNKDVLFASVPSIFDFSEGSHARIIMKNIEKIKEDNDLFCFNSDDLADSLCKEMITFLSNKNNEKSCRVSIWKLIQNTPKPETKPDFSNILKILIPLFKETDEIIESMPGDLDGVSAASYFLKSYMINNKTIFDIIEEGIQKTPS